MIYTTLIETDELLPHLDDATWAIVDCRFSLQDTEQGRRAYRQAHIPGAVYAHLDEDLSGPLIPGKTSRHPLPDVAVFARTLSGWGIGPDTQVVAYDDMGGAIAARLWWMLRWLGHDAVAVLNGGWPAWLAAGLPQRSGVEKRPPAVFVPHPRPDLLVTADEVMENLVRPTFTLIDSRAPERYRGETEPLDPVAGHIPRAINLPYADNVDQDKRFLAADELRRRFESILGDQGSQSVAFYCGSGVTAAHNILAMAHAGLGLPRLYAGSWSEWITDPARPVERE
jgi:thiosulfate/3-mercaptopyruvate sulfurtransferase